MGVAISRITRPLRNFNIENRVVRTIEKREKIPEPAPKHATTVKKLQRFREENQEVLEAQMKRDGTLHENLKKIYLESKDPQTQTSNSTKPLPLERRAHSETEYGVMDTPYVVPEGKANLKTIISFIGQYQENREAVTVTKIADEHKLDKTEVQNVLNHFKVMHLHIPEEMFKKYKNMHKIVSEQLQAGTSITSKFQLAEEDKQKQIASDPVDGLSHPKT